MIVIIKITIDKCSFRCIFCASKTVVDLVRLELQSIGCGAAGVVSRAAFCDLDGQKRIGKTSRVKEHKNSPRATKAPSQDWEKPKVGETARIVGTNPIIYWLFKVAIHTLMRDWCIFNQSIEPFEHLFRSSQYMISDEGVGR